jgi:hypothetical protein
MTTAIKNVGWVPVCSNCGPMPGPVFQSRSSVLDWVLFLGWKKKRKKLLCQHCKKAKAKP